MKCFKCSTDNNLKERTANEGRCKECNHPFAFEPTSMKDVKFTDAFFSKVISDISVNNTLFFTPKQFLYFLDKRLTNKSFALKGIVFFYLILSFWTTLFFGNILLGFFIRGFSFLFVWMIYNLLWIFFLFRSSNSQKSIYTARQYYAKAIYFLGFFILIVGTLWSLNTNSLNGYFLTLVLGLSALWLGVLQMRRTAKITDSFLINAAQMQNWLDNWTFINGTVTQLLPTPQTALQAAVSSNIHSDVTAYSFDRLVVCNSDEIAQMLISNNFHFENNCAILSISGYPSSIFETVIQMLKRNQDLIVYALHDASPEGIKLVHQISTSPNWFQGSQVTIIDLGLLPRQVITNSRHLFVQNRLNSAVAAKQLTPEIRQNLTKDEIAWLEAGNFVELESFTPQQLIRILNRGITSSQELDLSVPGMIIWAGDNTSNTDGIESFG